ncbi:MAG: exodeoxyribonuclease VII large subunit [Pseudomonadota bacterium]
MTPPRRASGLLDFDDDDDAPAAPDSGAAQGGNALEVTVSELSGRIKRTMEDAYGHVRVRGEIGRVSRPRSGHVYLDLKDERAVLSGVIWRGVAERLKIQPQEGLEVVASGKITTFPGQSKYQIVIDSLAPAGVGALMAMLEERKKRLAAEGLFAPERKKAIPFLPEVIGVVTSPSGAVIRDILHRLADRFPRPVLVWPVAVQGEACAPQVAAALRGFNALAPGGPIPRPDLLIVARGGGSLEDLWGFNEEIVARAAAESAIPLISAVGHETDTTLIDYVADRRAPTPTAAAEMAAPVRSELLSQLSQFEARRAQALARLLEERRSRVRDLGRALPRPEDLLALPRQRFDAAAERLPRALLGAVRAQELRLGRVSGRLAPAMLTRRIETEGRTAAGLGARLGPALRRAAELARDRFDRGRYAERLARISAAEAERSRERLEKLGRLLDGFSYKATLSRGYAAVWGEGGVVSSAEAAAQSGALEIEFADGRLPVAPKAAKGPDPQGELF